MVYGVGYILNKETRINGIQEESYKTWLQMLRRCYSQKEQIRYPKYKECIVSNEWLCYDNFKKWYNDNFYQIDNEKMALDKDILIKGNKIYSPETCVFVSNRINVLFTKSNATRGDYPIGVSWNKREEKFRAYCQTSFGKQKHLGYYSTPEDAFYKGYKPFKERYIKEIAEEYKNKIPKKLYDALYNYEVEITD